MNNKIKRSIAVICAAAAICAPLSSNTVFSGVIADQITASAAAEVHSGTHYGYRIDCPSEGYTLYIGIPDLRGTTCQVIGCTTTKDSVNIYVPETYTNGNYQYKIDKICDDAFRDQTRLNNVSLGRNITAIGQAAFMGCTNLKYFSTSAINGNGDMLLTTVGAHAFRNCENADFFIMSFRNVKNVGRMAFRGCSNLKTILMPSLENMDKQSFAECYNLEEIDLSESSVYTIPEKAFEYSCSDKNKECIVKLPSTVQYIGNYAFHNANGIRKIDITSVSSIGEGAFMDCHGLKTVMSGSNLSCIGDRAFFGCDPMKYFACKNDYVYIGNQALGYDDIRNYQGIKQNFTLWGVSNYGSAKRYADSQSTALPFRTIGESASYASSRYTDYEWQKANTGINWGYVNAWVYYNFEANHKPYANGYDGQEWHGVCAGMATVSALTSSGYLSVSDYASGYNRLRDIGYTIPYSVKSYVTTVWANGLVELGRAFDYQTKTYRNSQWVFDKEALNYAENITYGADAAVLSILPSNSAGHAVVCFGMEYKNNASDKNDPCWNGWDARLLIYDVNNNFVNDANGGKAHDKADYIYVNLSDGSWYSSLISKHGFNINDVKLALTHSYDKSVNASKYGMTTDQFFAAIRNN